MTQKQAIPPTCPLPKTRYDKILMGHGSGGKMTSHLIEELFIPAFGSHSTPLHDGAFIPFGEQLLAFTTDSYVVKPLFFPGGNIGDLAVNGTVNDLAMCGAKPQYLSCGFILEEGFEVEKLNTIIQCMRAAADTAGVDIITGDTKVIEKASGDGIYVNTSGLGIVERKPFTPQQIMPGDLILINGDVGRHGTAIMSVREGLEFDASIESDTCELWSLVKTMQDEGIPVHCMRDLTRGGLATALVELAEGCRLNFCIDEKAVPVNETVRGACEFLGLDPLYVACEGRAVAFVPKEWADPALEVMKAIDSSAAVIGEVHETSNRPVVTAKTFVGTKRLLDKLSGDQLPRIC